MGGDEHAVRILGKPGVVAHAITAIDIALWDLQARLLDVPLVIAIGAVHDATPIYGSGGFTSYDDDTLAVQLAGCVEAGIPRVKMKVGRDPGADPKRLRAARRAIGGSAEPFVDANGAFQRKDALLWAQRFSEHGVRWFEEPVSSDDLDSLRLVRDRGPAGMDITAGEYGYHLPYFQQMLDAGAVDCLQADVTRALGVSGCCESPPCATRAASSCHCTARRRSALMSAPPSGTCVTWSTPRPRPDRRIAFDGVLEPQPGGVLRPDCSRPGLGLDVKQADLEPFRVG